MSYLKSNDNIGLTFKILLWLVPINCVLFELYLLFGGIFKYSAYIISPLIIFLLLNKLIKTYFSNFKPNILFLFCFLVTFVCVYIQFVFSENTINNFLLWNIYGFSTWLFPIFFLFTVRNSALLPFIKVIRKISIIGVFIGFAFLAMQYFSPISIRRYSAALLFGTFLLVIVYEVYGLRGKRTLLFIGVIVYFLLSFSSMKREDVLYALLMIFGLLIFTFNRPKKWKIYFYIIALIGLLFILVQPIETMNSFTGVLPQKSQINSNSVQDLLFQDSRGTLSDDFYEDMENDVFFGRGLNGTYSTPTFSPYYNENFGGRDIVEIGYLQILLKGGILLLISYLLIILRALYLGLFNTKNHLTKIFAYAIVVHMIIMFWARVPAADPPFMLLWLLVGFCFSKATRNLTDNDIKEALICIK